MDIAKIASERLIEIARLTKERDELRAKLAAMESQESELWSKAADCLEGSDAPKGAKFWRDGMVNLFRNRASRSNPAPAEKPEVEQRCAECGPVDAGTALYCVKCWDCAHKPAVAVQDGWKLVPVEITDAMADASGCEGQFKISAHEQAARIWSAMLEAAPSHSQQAVLPYGFKIERNNNHIVVTGPDNGQGISYADETLYQLIIAMLSAHSPRDQQFVNIPNVSCRECNYYAANSVQCVTGGNVRHGLIGQCELARPTANRCPSHESEQPRSPAEELKSLQRYAERCRKNREQGGGV